MQSPLAPLGSRGDGNVASSLCTSLFSLHGDISQYVGARCTVCPTGACSSQRYSGKVFLSFRAQRVRTLLVYVPAALWECWDQGVVSQAGTPLQGLTNPKTGGRLTQAPAGTNPTTGSRPPLFFNLVGIFKLVGRAGGLRVDFNDDVSEVSSLCSTMRCWSPAVLFVVCVSFMLLPSDGLGVFYFSFGARDAEFCIAGVHLLVVLPGLWEKCLEVPCLVPCVLVVCVVVSEDRPRDISLPEFYCGWYVSLLR